MIRKAFSAKQTFSVVAIEGGFVKFIQARESSGVRKISKLIVRKAASQSNKDIVFTLKQILAELKSGLGDLTLCIPHHKITVRFLRFPSSNEKEISGMVKLQAAKELPFSKEEINYDYLITEKTPEGYTKVALLIVHNDVINGYLDLLKKVGLEPSRITFGTEGVLGWFQYNFAPDEIKGGSILIDLDSDNTDLAVFYGSCLDFTRGLNFGLRQLGADSDLKHRLAQEIKRTIVGYGRQDKNRKVQRILLGPAGKMTEELKQFLGQELSLSCEVFEPFEKLGTEGLSAAVEYRGEVSLLDVAGAILPASEKRPNLLPADLRQKQAIGVRRKKTKRISTLLLVILFLLVLILFKKFNDKQLRVFYLDEEIKRTAPLAKKAEASLKKIELIQRRSRLQGSSIDVLRQLHILASANIELASFNFDEDEQALRLEGVCTNMPEILRFVDALDKSPFFQKVQLKYVAEKKARSGGNIDFKIKCSL